MEEYKLVNTSQFNPDEIINQTNSIKDLLTFDFNDNHDNISRNLRILELLYVEIGKIQKRLKDSGIK